MDEQKLTVNYELNSFCVIYCGELEKYAKCKYNQDLVIVAAEEWHHDELYGAFGPFYPEHMMDSYDGEDWEEFKSNGKASFGITPLLLQALVWENVIPQGICIIIRT